MKKKHLILFIVTLLFLVGCSNSAASEPKNYKDYVSYFDSISIDNLNEKLQGEESFFVYVGRESCPYCRTFVPKLYEALKKSEINTIYYLDVEKDNDLGKINQFRSRFQIKYVPYFALFREEKYEILQFSSEEITVNELVDYLNTRDQE
jgi:predicted bacteriocin transport accessory protein